MSTKMRANDYPCRERNVLITAPTTNRLARIPLWIGANIALRTITRVPTMTNVTGNMIVGR